MAERPKIKFNYVTDIIRRKQPITEADFVEEMATEAVIDLIIQGYHMGPDGTEYFAEDVPFKE